MANKADGVLILAAGLPSVFFLKGGRLLRYGALAVLVGALAMILLGSEGLAGAVIVTVANTLLVSAAAFTTRKQLTQTEDRLKAIGSAVRDLEIAEERRQAFSAKNARAPRLK
ncbi:hypothetical protein ABSY17_03235 (plasmid) [Mesorhizobium sp. ANAO-SY3R2]